MMLYLRDNFVDPLAYESTDAETELLKFDWRAMMAVLVSLCDTYLVSSTVGGIWLEVYGL